MFIRDFFKPVPRVSVKELRDTLRKTGGVNYNLIDVRQPAEYKNGHLPGAQLVPLPELITRMKELDTSKPTVTY